MTVFVDILAGKKFGTHLWIPSRRSETSDSNHGPETVRRPNPQLTRAYSGALPVRLAATGRDIQSVPQLVTVYT